MGDGHGSGDIVFQLGVEPNDGQCMNKKKKPHQWDFNTAKQRNSYFNLDSRTEKTLSS